MLLLLGVLVVHQVHCCAALRQRTVRQLSGERRLRVESVCWLAFGLFSLFSMLSMRHERGMAEPVSRDQILRRERGTEEQKNKWYTYFPCIQQDLVYHGVYTRVMPEVCYLCTS